MFELEKNLLGDCTPSKGVKTALSKRYVNHSVYCDLCTYS
jgi:hypothetical protein